MTDEKNGLKKTLIAPKEEIMRMFVFDYRKALDPRLKSELVTFQQARV
jgi:hypothetical protein